VVVTVAGTAAVGAVVKLLVIGTSFIDVGQRDSVAAKVRIS